MNTLATRENTPTTETRERENFRKPRYHVVENSDNFEIAVQLPGVTRANTEISLDKDLLTVTGRRQEVLAEGWKTVSRETTGFDFRLQLELNIDIDGDKISAKSEDGILRLTLPKAEAVKARTISVE